MSDTKRRNMQLWDWRQYFVRSTLNLAQHDYVVGKLVEFEIGEDGLSAQGTTVNGFHPQVKRIPASYDDYVNYPRWDTLTGSSWNSGSNHFSNYYYCTCVQGSQGTRCRHLANLMLKWEAVHGPFVLFESEEDRAARLERERREAEKARKQKITRAVADCFDAVSLTRAQFHFNPDVIIKNSNFSTDQYELEESKRLLQENPDVLLTVDIGFDQKDEQNLRGMLTLEKQTAVIQCDHSIIQDVSCDCGRTRMPTYWYKGSGGKACAHVLALWSRMRDFIVKKNPGDSTDAQADMLLKLIANGSPREESTLPAPSRQTKKKNVALQARLMQDRNDPADIKLGFDIGYVGNRLYGVKGLESLVKAVDEEETFKLTAKASVNFAEEAFNDDALPWYQLILGRVRRVERLNERLRQSYYTRRMSAGEGIPMEDSDLDHVYDMTKGGEILYQYGTRTEACPVPVGRAKPQAEITIEPIGKGIKLTGVKVSGAMPRLLQGTQRQYILDKTCFGQVDPAEMAILEPFRAIADAEGNFSCVIGEKKFAEFYYRVLPKLQDAGQIVLIDHVGSKLENLVPPEPEFTFYIDLTDVITCLTEVRYGGQTELPLDALRDVDQENRVAAAVAEFFPVQGKDPRVRWAVNDDDTLVEILTDGVQALSVYGEVKGSDAFRHVHMRPMPAPKVSLRVDGGLLDLSIQTKDYTSDELLDLLSSYRLKKRWHRLKNGDFVDLSDPEAFDELIDTVESMDISPEQLIREGAQVPKYRALYVDKLLEAHNELAAARDRAFKALIRSFQTIRDSDFEVSQGLTDVLRPYQVYGFRWLSTLGQSGFGGILADEMGLGKTLQLLAFIESQREAGETRPSLVVCPASLVYNWREECKKFTPTLTVETLDGTLPYRKKLLAGMGEDGHALLYITSYDLLKRDIEQYDGLTFGTIALDEAQYVKNQRTAVSKAVRVLKAEHRFALTGTPIENRLAELWSIFDFLMPGFLYSSQEFASRFETPIMKQKDPAATERLAKMTEPFILRRKKADVLKDLPEKLEETRASAMEPDQRRVYDAEVVRMKELLAASDDSGADKMRILAEITRLRQLCCDPSLVFENYEGSSAKRVACLELIQNAIDAGHRMLVFSQFTSMLALLADDLKKAGISFFTITGSTPKQERLRLVNEYNAGDTPVFLISLKAGGTGLNLTGADVVIHYDPWWNLAVQNQATDRAHRIGQTRQVTVIRLIAAETIEEKIVQLQEAKRELAETIISGEGGSLMSFTREELLALLG